MRNITILLIIIIGLIASAGVASAIPPLPIVGYNALSRKKSYGYIMGWNEIERELAGEIDLSWSYIQWIYSRVVYRIPEHLKMIVPKNKSIWEQFYSAIFGKFYKEIMPWLKLRRRRPLPTINFSAIWRHWKHCGHKKHYNNKTGTGLVVISLNDTVIQISEIGNTLLPTEKFYVLSKKGNYSTVIRYSPQLVGKWYNVTKRLRVFIGYLDFVKAETVYEKDAIYVKLHFKIVGPNGYIENPLAYELRNGEFRAWINIGNDDYGALLEAEGNELVAKIKLHWRFMQNFIPPRACVVEVFYVDAGLPAIVSGDRIMAFTLQVDVLHIWLVRREDKMEAIAELGGYAVWEKLYEVRSDKPLYDQMPHFINSALEDFRSEYEGANGIVIPIVSVAKA